MKALYDLGRQIVSFNFFEWLLVAQINGATKVIFKNDTIKADKWPAAISRNRFNSILKPGPALAGMTWDTGYDGLTDLAPFNCSAEIVRLWKKGMRFRRLRSVLMPYRTHRYTVTLRQTQRSLGRNSHELDWRRFAAEIGALVIEDYDVKPISLHDRVALYAGAEMNFFVSNGPAILCSFTEYPCMIFDCHLAEGSLKSDGIGRGGQYPWMANNQFAIWEAAEYDNIMQCFKIWKDGNDPRERTAATTPPTPDGGMGGLRPGAEGSAGAG